MIDMPMAGIASPQPVLEASALQRTVLDNGLVFHHAEAGAGTPLVFLHGVLGDWRTWAPQWAAFVPHFRCISYSRRYSVPNGNRVASPDHSALAEADDLEALLAHWHAAPAVLVGASYGAYTALALAARRPEQMRALVLVEPPLMRLADTSAEGRAIRSEFDRHIRLPARRAFEAGDDARAVWLLTEGILGGTDLGQQSGAAMGRRLENAESLRRVTLSSDEFPALDMDRLAALDMPVLLLSGERTPPIHDVVFRALAQALPRAESLKVPGAGHGVARDQPAAFNALVLEFLKRHGLWS
ncbi:MAG: alpha/beta hydrolase [Burkholderiales bacterium]|nr:alpha/beta hydrolase [Burkholderiales bacterium]